jgi:hypothetical protein
VYALSLKQPWAALLAHGRKTIEVRRWPTARRGRILIHAAKISDDRPEAWAYVPTSLQAAARLTGGIIGTGDLTGCVPYRTLETFTADQLHHLNPGAWFQGPDLFGFTFTNLTPLPFRPCRGQMRFFPVPDGDLESESSRQKAAGRKDPKNLLFDI